MRIGSVVVSSWTLLSLLTLIAGLSLSAPTSGAESSDDALRVLEERYPGIRFHQQADRIQIYGVPMTGSGTPEQAAANWLRDHAFALGATGAEIRLVRDFPVHYGKFHVFHYEQRLGNLVVEESRGRLLVLEPIATDGPGSRWQVVYAAMAGTVTAPVDGFPTDQLSGPEAVATIQGMAKYADLDVWGSPSLVIHPGATPASAPHRAWKFEGYRSNKTKPRAFTFYVDTATGALLRARTDIHTFDVDGTVEGNITPGTEPDNASNTPVLSTLPGVQVDVDGTIAYAGDDGGYVVTGLGGTSVSVETQLTTEWVTVIASQGVDEVLSDTATPPATVDFVFNTAEDEFTTSQVNALYHTHRTHDFFKDRVPGYLGLDISLDCFVNINDACNAFYTSSGNQSINFFNEGTLGADTCVNTAFSSVIAHEYGHFVVNSLALAQGAFGEGFGDSVSLLLFDDPILGRDFAGAGDHVRDIVTANQQYPCTSTIHTCGQVLAGVWWDIKLEMEITDATTGLEDTQQLFVDWSMITLGGSGSDSAHPGTAIEVLVVDDDDGRIGNGTPNRAEICTGFDDHGIDCPDQDPIKFVYANGIPRRLEPDESTVFPVSIEGVTGTPEDLTGKLHYSTNGSTFTTVDLTSTGVNEYDVEIPIDPVDGCGDEILFYLSAEDDLAVEVTDPPGAPSTVFQAIVGTDRVLILDDEFETDEGWTTGDPSDADTATTGVWERVAPVGTAAQPGLDFPGGTGTLCFVTGQGSIGGGLGENDIDGGKTTLMTPTLDLSGDGEFFISYFRWYSNDTGAEPNTDSFEIDISDDDGTTWFNVETVGPTGTDTGGGWFFHVFRVSDIVTPNDEIKMRFVASDLAGGSIVEAAIDNFQVERFPCDITCTAPAITADPSGTTECEDETVTFSVTATGTGPLSYQWRKDGTDIGGATSDSLTLDPIVPADAADYDVVVSNACGSATSTTAALTVDLKPTVVTEPASQAVCDGQVATLSVVATGPAPISYQWRKDAANLVGETGSSLTIDPVAPADAGDYDVIVTNDCGDVTSAAATLTVDAMPQIDTEPASQTVCAGLEATFSVSASGTAPLSYQWRKDGSNLADETGTSLTIDPVTTADAADYDVVVTNTCGSATSVLATLTVDVTPTVTSQPVSATVCENDEVTFSITATGSGTLTYQWRKDTTDISGATSADYTIGSVQTTDSAEYDCVVTNHCGSITSDAATLTVDVAPSFTGEPADLTVCSGDDATFTVVASGTGLLDYQWRKGGTDIAGATTDTLIISGADIGDADDYDVVVSNDCGSVTSAPATLTVDVTPTISTEPVSSTVCEGEDATFTVVATGPAPLSYQWRKNGANVSGATADTLTIANAVLSDADDYDVVITNDCGSVTSALVSLTVDLDPSITTPPTSASVCEGDDVTLSVTATGAGPLSYQWRKDGTNIAGETNDTLTIEGTTAGDAADYDVVVSNACESATSVAATLTVDLDPVITTEPASATVCEGDDATFSVVATGAAPLSYQWRKGGTNIAGETDDTLTITGVVPGDAADYDVVISNDCGSITSGLANLTVALDPTISVDPTSLTVCEGEDATLTVMAAGATPLSYQWRKDGSNIAGETDDTLTIEGAAAGDAADYDVIVSNDCGSTTSSTATLTIDLDPVITTEPSGATACAGDAFTFTVVADGAAPLTYQWRLDGGDIAGANAASLTIDPVAASDAGGYSVVVSNDCGSVTSSEAELAVNPDPAISTAPSDTTVCADDDVTFDVTVTGVEPLTYQWRKDGNDIADATSASLTLEGVTTADAADYDVVITDDCNATVTSAMATLTVEVSPTITMDPAAVTACVGDDVSFMVSADGTAPLSFQWRKDGTDLPGETDATLELLGVDTDDAADYSVVVTNDCGSTTSTAATLTIETAPVIDDATAERQMGGAAYSVAFSADVTGSAPVDYDWDFGDDETSTDPEPTHTYASADIYTVILTVTNDCGSDTLTFDVDLTANRFKRGDANGDGTVSTITDALFILDYGFARGPEPPCFDAADVDNSNSLNALIDALLLLDWAFAGGTEPADPGPDDCGEDPEGDTDGLSCEVTAEDCL